MYPFTRAEARGLRLMSDDLFSLVQQAMQSGHVETLRMDVVKPKVLLLVVNDGAQAATPQFPGVLPTMQSRYHNNCCGSILFVSDR